METKVLLRLINDDIKLLDDINKTFISDEKLSPGEVELALARARSLVAEFEMLSRNIAEPIEVIERSEERIKSEIQHKVDAISKEQDLSNNESELIDLEEEEVSKPIVEEVVVKTSVEEITVAGKTTQKEKAEKAAKPEKAAKGLVEEELFEEISQKNGKSLDEMTVEKHELVNELLATDRSERKFEGMPLTSIRDGIAINDRYLFTKELFGNEAEKYEETITTLDGLATIEEAVSYLKLNFKWNKTEGGQKFLALVKRRFTK
jgi:hypothetical protein